MSSTLFSFPDNETIANSLTTQLKIQSGEFTYRHFPDGETYIRILSSVENHDVYILCSLNQPDCKLLPIIFLADTAKNMGAKSVTLIAPYLAYMRQDTHFHSGESLSAQSFAEVLSHHIDWLITIDPHLHRYASLNEIYKIKTSVLHVAPIVAEWIKANIKKPVLIGPDVESKQWVANIAEAVNAPYSILQKTRRGDRDVEVSLLNVENYLDHTPVLVDDIISTASTMMKTLEQLKQVAIKPAYCIGIHAVFAGEAYQQLLKFKVENIVTCNTITHTSNEIDISQVLVELLRKPEDKL